MGRNKAGGEKATELVWLRLPLRYKDALKDEADAEGRKVANYLQRLVIQHLERPKTTI